MGPRPVIEPLHPVDARDPRLGTAGEGGPAARLVLQTRSQALGHRPAPAAPGAAPRLPYVVDRGLAILLGIRLSHYAAARHAGFPLRSGTFTLPLLAVSEKTIQFTPPGSSSTTLTSPVTPARLAQESTAPSVTPTASASSTAPRPAAPSYTSPQTPPALSVQVSVRTLPDSGMPRRHYGPSTTVRAARRSHRRRDQCTRDTERSRCSNSTRG